MAKLKLEMPLEYIYIYIYWVISNMVTMKQK